MTKLEIEKNISLKTEVLSFIIKFNLRLDWPKDYIRIIYHYENNLEQIPTCYCGKEVLFRSKNKGYRKTCSFYCNVNDPKKYLRVKKTKLEKYGDENYNNFEKNKVTKLQKYGDENYNNRPKAFETNIKIYGHHSPVKNDDVKMLSKKTKKEKYGNENYNNINKIKEFWKNAGDDYINQTINKNKKTKLERYGNENYNNTNKMIKTKLERYGFYYTNIEKSNLSKRTKFKERYLKYGIEHIRSDESYYYFECNKCLLEFKISKTMILNRTNDSSVVCTKCNKKYQSSMEIDLYNIIKKLYDSDIEVGNKKILDGKEIDIYLPNIKLGIEFNGVYWHSSNLKDNMYHFEKKKLGIEKGIDIIFIWEDDWELNKLNIIEMLEMIINIKDNNEFIKLDKCPSDLYIRNFGEILDWKIPQLKNRVGFDTYDSGFMILS